MAKTKKSAYSKNFKHQSRRTLVILIIALLAIYVLLPQLHVFKNSFSALLQANYAFLFLAVVLTVLTYFVAAATFCFLAYFKLPYWRTLLVQVADGFTNRLLPVGLGGVATFALYLIKQSKGQTEAGYIAAVNNILGFIGHAILLLIVLSITKTPISNLVVVKLSGPAIILLVVILSFGSVAIIIKKKPHKLSQKASASLLKVFKFLLFHPGRLLLALLSSMSVTILHGLTLYATMVALNVHLSVLQIFVVLTAGVATMAVTPTPGGLGGAEAGIVASLVAIGVQTSPALTVALTYRFITYWLPLIPGFFAFNISLRKGYFSLS